MKMVNPCRKGAKVDQKAIGGVEVATLHVKVGSIVCLTIFAELVGDGDVRREPVTVSQKAPIKQCTCSSSIPVAEWVLVCEKGVQKDCLKDGVKEGDTFGVRLIGECHKRFQTMGKVFRRWGKIDGFPCGAHHADVFLWAAITPLLSLCQGPPRQRSVNAEEQFLCQRFCFPVLKCRDGGVIVDDHLLGGGAWGTTFGQHLSGNGSRGRRTFHLAGRNGLHDLGLLEIVSPHIREVLL